MVENPVSNFLKDDSGLITDDYDEEDYVDLKYKAKFTASEIAALIGKHEYRTIAQGLYKVLQKTDKFKSLIEEIKYETRNKKEIIVNKYLKAASNDIQKIIDDVTKDQPSGTIDTYVDTQIALAMSNLDLNDDNDIKIRVRKELKSRVAMRRGVHLENVSIEELELEHGIKITSRNNKLYKLDCEYFQLSGKVDGIDEDGECVIEIKNRMKYIHEVPFYDMIQCVMYMKLTNYKKCLLVECFPDKKVRKTLIEWDENHYQSIHDSLCDLVKKIRKMTKKELAELIKQYDIDCAAE